MATALRKDHRLYCRLIEAKNLGRNEECDTYCVVKVIYHGGAVQAMKSSTRNLHDLKDKSANTSAASLTKLKKSQMSTSTGSVTSLSGRKPSSKNCGDIKYQSRTKTCWHSKTPWFDEEFEFDLQDGFKEIRIDLMIRNLLVDRLLGRVVLSRQSLEHDGHPHQEWCAIKIVDTNEIDNSNMPDSINVESGTSNAFAVNKKHEFVSTLIARPQPCACGLCESTVMLNALKCNQCGSMFNKKCIDAAPTNCGVVGMLRLRYVYADEFVMPIATYSKLLMQLLNENFRVISVLGRVTDDRDDIAKIMVIITENARIADKYLNCIASKEIQRTLDPNTIFRGNSLGSKSIDHYLKLVGARYLKDVLHDVVKDIYTQNKCCELDPTRNDVGKKSDQHSLENLTSYIKLILDRIFNSAETMPFQMKQIFSHLRSEAIAKFPNDNVIMHTVVTSFIFLRFFNAAILGPHLFGVAPDNELPSGNVARTLTLISKTIQQLANMSLFDGRKEPFMSQLNPLVQENLPHMQKFLNDICKPLTNEQFEAFRIAASDQNNNENGIIRFLKLLKVESVQKKEKQEIFIERYFASIHRHLIRNIQVMLDQASDEEKHDVEIMKQVIDEMMEKYVESAQEAENWRAIDILSEPTVNEITLTAEGPVSARIAQRSSDKLNEIVKRSISQKLNFAIEPSSTGASPTATLKTESYLEDIREQFHTVQENLSALSMDEPATEVKRSKISQA